MPTALPWTWECWRVTLATAGQCSYQARPGSTVCWTADLFVARRPSHLLRGDNAILSAGASSATSEYGVTPRPGPAEVPKCTCLPPDRAALPTRTGDSRHLRRVALAHQRGRLHP